MLQERREREQERSKMLLRRSAESAARSGARGVPVEPPPGYMWSGQPGGSVIPIGAREMLNAPYNNVSQQMRSVEKERDAALRAKVRRLRGGSRREQQERADLLQGVVDGELIFVPTDCRQTTERAVQDAHIRSRSCMIAAFHDIALQLKLCLPVLPTT